MSDESPRECIEPCVVCKAIVRAGRPVVGGLCHVCAESFARTVRLEAAASERADDDFEGAVIESLTDGVEEALEAFGR